jgi:copper chaperone CopZ
MTKKIYKIEGMDCPNCATMLECDLEDLGCKAKCSYANSTLEILGAHDRKKVEEIVNKGGYTIK